MDFNSKNLDIISEILIGIQQQLEVKVKAYTEIYPDEPYPTDMQKDAVWLKDTHEYANKLFQIQKDFIDIIKKEMLISTVHEKNAHAPGDWEIIVEMLLMFQQQWKSKIKAQLETSLEEPRKIEIQKKAEWFIVNLRKKSYFQ